MKEETISLRESLRRLILEKHEKPVIADYEIHWYLYELYRDKYYDGIKIGKITASEPDYRVINDAAANLIHRGIISRCVDGNVYVINNREKPTAQQVICCLNPCSYIAYISAMEWHGITDRINHTIHVIQSYPSFMNDLFREKIRKNFPNITNDSYLFPKNISSIDTYDGKKFVPHKTKNFKMRNEQFSSGGVRVTNIGETFLDMIKKPEFCGGFNHVINVFENYAKKYLPVILKEITKNGSSMDQARAGYILEEICGLNHKSIDEWKINVQRGGSRKLVSSNPYSDVFSEVWCISINI
ncbi:TPA: type IV toxin-antitoxin system AbiEi family antitoxin [Yersinia enterocolitica]|nr:hypothetical protein [Yersinia enterocolitica]HDL6653680.1 hypothetical protein [Yersinia enterocolitica]HDL8439148.1 hypothetical protein [Yersinia enterocolitica]HEF9708170.1 hypothetical protein [Yersinia enterocolitica]